MATSIKNLFLGYLTQLQVIVEKVPDELFSESLHQDMFSLEINVQIAANFLLRGYCPLLGKDVILTELSEPGKESALALIADIQAQLETLPDLMEFDDSITLSDKAGFNKVNLPQSEYILKYIIPNFMFHMSMVYATARKSGVGLSKGDFDGLHSYPTGFSFLN